jgi:hypothetical protein
MPHVQTTIPGSVVEAIRLVREQAPPELELWDEENVLYVAHCCGLDDARDWLCEHRDLYFEAVRRATHESIGGRARA